MSDWEGVVIPTAFIPAKGTSIGIHNKNLQTVGGISLVKRTYDFAMNANPIDRVVVSTDSYEVFIECISDGLSKNDFLNIQPGSVHQINRVTYLHVRRNQDIGGAILHLLNVPENPYWRKRMREGSSMRGERGDDG